MPRKRPAAPWLETRGSVFYAFWYNPDKRQRESLSLRTADPKEATERFAAFLLQGSDIYGSSRLHALTVKTALDDYETEHVNKKVVDKARFRMIRDNLNAHFGGLEVKAIDDKAVETYTTRRLTGEISGKGHAKEWKPRPATSNTIRRELVVLVAAINHERKRKNPDGKPRLPASDVPFIPLPIENEDEAPSLDRGQFAKLRAEAQRRLAAATAAAMAEPDRGDLESNATHAQRLCDFIEIAYYTAGRRRSVEQLTWFQVTLDRQRIKLAKPGERRTKKRRPVVRIDPELMPTLRRLHDTKTNEYVLGSAGSVYRAFCKACAAIGVEASPHILRHTRASHLLQDGEDIWNVAKLLGDTVATVEKVYGHHSPDYQRFISERKKESGR
jgi:integrase